jgi:hypothetical protein
MERCRSRALTSWLVLVGAATVTGGSSCERPAPATTPHAERAASDATGKGADALAPALEVVRQHMGAGRLPDHERSFGLAVRAVSSTPEAAGQLLVLFRGDDANSAARGLLLDVLARSGQAEAQAAMREALQSDAGRTDPRHDELFARLGLVEAPDADTLDLVRTELAAARKSGEVPRLLARAETAGAVARQVAKSTPEARDPIADELGELLRDAASPAERARLVGALARAGRASDHAQIADLVSSTDAALRRSVARALAGPATDVGVEALLGLMTDAAPSVQAEALKSLRAHVLTAEHYGRLAALVAGKRVHPQNHRALLGLVKRDRQRLPTATEGVLRAMHKLEVDGSVRDELDKALEP